MIIIKGSSRESHCNSHSNNNRESTGRSTRAETDTKAKKTNDHPSTIPPPSPYSLLFSPAASFLPPPPSLHSRNLSKVIDITSLPLIIHLLSMHCSSLSSPTGTDIYS